MIDADRHELFTHRYVEPATVVLPKVAVGPPPRQRFVDGPVRTRALRGVALGGAGLFALMAVIGMGSQSGEHTTSSVSGSSASTAADECSQVVLGALRSDLPDMAAGVGSGEVLRTYGQRSIEWAAYQAGLGSDAQAEAFRHGADAGARAAAPVVAQACASGYGDAPAASSSTAVDMPADDCSMEVLDALEYDTRNATLDDVPGAGAITAQHGVDSPEYRAYVAAVEKYMVESGRYGSARAVAATAPIVESSCRG